MLTGGRQRRAFKESRSWLFIPETTGKPLEVFKGEWLDKPGEGRRDR